MQKRKANRHLNIGKTILVQEQKCSGTCKMMKAVVIKPFIKKMIGFVVKEHSWTTKKMFPEARIPTSSNKKMYFQDMVHFHVLHRRIMISKISINCRIIRDQCHLSTMTILSTGRIMRQYFTRQKCHSAIFVDFYWQWALIIARDCDCWCFLQGRLLSTDCAQLKSRTADSQASYKWGNVYCFWEWKWMTANKNRT